MPRIYLSADTIFYAAPASIGTGDGSSAANAMGDEQSALDYLQTNFDKNGYTLRMQLLAGTYSRGIQMTGPIIGGDKPGGSPLIIQGDPANPDAYVFNTPGVNTFSFIQGAVATIVGFTISASGASCLYATQGGIIEYGGIRFGTANSHIRADIDGFLVCTSTDEMVQGANEHYSINKGYIGVVPGVIMKCDVQYGIGFQDFFSIEKGGQLDLPVNLLTWQGNFSGSRGIVKNGGRADCGGAVNSIPGSSAAIVADSYSQIM